MPGEGDAPAGEGQESRVCRTGKPQDATGGAKSRELRWSGSSGTDGRRQAFALRSGVRIPSGVTLGVPISGAVVGGMSVKRAIFFNRLPPFFELCISGSGPWVFQGRRLSATAIRSTLSIPVFADCPVHITLCADCSWHICSRWGKNSPHEYPILAEVAVKGQAGLKAQAPLPASVPGEKARLPRPSYRASSGIR